ncbi:MAG: DUF4133 domain-containing protein [Chitinophagaceae bacterium]
MNTSIYNINKGINKSIEFKGLKAQYIWYLAAGLLGLLILFATLYICGVNTYVCLGVIITSGSFLFMYVYKLSGKYGQHGMMKAVAKRSIPHVVKCDCRKIFIKLKKSVINEVK